MKTGGLYAGYQRLKYSGTDRKWGKRMVIPLVWGDDRIHYRKEKMGMVADYIYNYYLWNGKFSDTKASDSPTVFALGWHKLLGATNLLNVLVYIARILWYNSTNYVARKELTMGIGPKQFFEQLDAITTFNSELTSDFWKDEIGKD